MLIGFTSRFEFDLFDAWVATLSGLDVLVRTGQTDAAIDHQTKLADLEESDYPGYAPFSVSTFDGPFIGSDGHARITTEEAVFIASDDVPGGQDVKSAFLTMSTGAAATGTVGQTGGVVDTPVVTAGGAGYLAPPRVTIEDSGGGTGTGAKAHATISGGVVTAIVIDDGGAGYTTPLVTIEAPCVLLLGGLLDSPRRIANNGDGFGLVLAIAHDGGEVVIVD